MPTAESAEGDIAALRAALVAAHGERVSGFRRPGMRAYARLHRFRLGWLVGPWVVAGVLRRLPRASRPSPTEERLVRLYAQATGVERDVARAEVDRIGGQLWLVDERSPSWLFPGFAGCRPASRAEVERAADALLRYFLCGRQTGDPLLAGTQAAYAAYEEESQRSALVWAAHPRRQTRRHRAARGQDQMAALRRYVDMWRRWFDAPESAHGGVGARRGTAPAAAGAAGDVAAVHEARVAALLSDGLDLPDGALIRAGERLADRPDRLRWLSAPLLLAGLVAGLVGSIRRSRAFLADDIHAVGLYSQLSGQDRDVSRAEVWRMRMQLALIKDGSARHEGRPGSSPASRAQLDAAADALLRYFLRGRQTDDPLLAETQAAYAAYEQLMQQFLEAGAERRPRRRRREEQATVDATERCIDHTREAWRRWFEHNQSRFERDGT
jgi:hypothetical protein